MITKFARLEFELFTKPSNWTFYEIIMFVQYYNMPYCSSEAFDLAIILAGSKDLVKRGFNTWILQASSLPYMQGAGHAAVVYYRKCSATQQMR
jgi:hypothetical protein